MPGDISTTRDTVLALQLQVLIFFQLHTLLIPSRNLYSNAFHARAVRSTKKRCRVFHWLS